MTTLHISKSDEATLALKLAAGIQQHFAATAQLYIAEKTLTPAQVAAQLQTLAALRTAVDAARAALQGKLADETTEGPALRAFYASVIGFVRIAYAGAPEILADFGLAPRKARKALTAEQQAAANAKSQATREARGTVGKKKKLAIKGKVTGVVVTPITPAPPPANGASNGAAH
jgi:hypothetical protein